MVSVLGRKGKREDARRGPAHHGVHGVTGQAVLHHVGKESGIELGSVDPLQVTLTFAQEPPLSLRCVTLVPVQDGVAGHHGAPALYPVVLGLAAGPGSVVHCPGVWGCQWRTLSVIVDHVLSGGHGKAGPGALLSVARETGQGPGSVYQGMAAAAIIQ